MLSSDEARVANYQRFLLAFLAVSPLALYSLSRLEPAPSGGPGHLALVIVAGVVLTIASEFGRLARGQQISSRRFWIREPTTYFETTLVDDPESCAQRVQERVVALGFTARPTTSPERLLFYKGRTKTGRGFLDRAFLGCLTFRASACGTDVSIDVRLLETVFVPRIEPARLAALAAHVCLDRDDYSVRSVPLLLLSGVHLAVLTALLGLGVGLAPERIGTWIFVTGAGAATLIILTLPGLLYNRRERLGLGLALSALALASLPYLAASLPLLRTWLGL
jgi:hypothetical protein